MFAFSLSPGRQNLLESGYYKTGSLPVIKLLPLNSKPTFYALPCDAGSEATLQLCQQLPTGLHQKEALEGDGRAGRRKRDPLLSAGPPFLGVSASSDALPQQQQAHRWQQPNFTCTFY